jgi:hypothetical protein
MLGMRRELLVEDERGERVCIYKHDLRGKAGWREAREKEDDAGAVELSRRWSMFEKGMHT